MNRHILIMIVITIMFSSIISGSEKQDITDSIGDYFSPKNLQQM